MLSHSAPTCRVVYFNLPLIAIGFWYSAFCTSLTDRFGNDGTGELRTGEVLTLPCLAGIGAARNGDTDCDLCRFVLAESNPSTLIFQYHFATDAYADYLAEIRDA